MEPADVTVAVLFTDLEGSTRLWETDPARMADALARHDRLCRTTVSGHCGRIVKMTGDGLYAVFDDAAAAVSGALALLQGMEKVSGESGLQLKLRCGLHAGVVQARDGDYFGVVVNRAARVMSAAHGGQALVTQAVVDLLAQRRPAGIDLAHLGRVRLRDLSAPEDVWQLLHPDLERTFPPLRSLDSTPNNLPQQTTSFIGRESEIADIKERLRETRLLTFTGSGGCGKTRLALQVAADNLENFGDGVWLVELAALTDPSLVPQTVASVLGVSPDAGKSLYESLVRHLESRHLLLLLDNAEHLLSESARLVNAILRQCPKVVVMVSSREPLGIGGELVFRVPSLTMPDPKVDVTPDKLLPYESVRLFVERAQFHWRQFAVTAANALAMAFVCHRLDGIPLAIELAAARVQSMTVEELNRRLDQRFRLLTGGSRTALPRQQTLRSTIDWSFDLLNHSEQVLLARLSVFADGWTLEAAEHVGAGDPIDAVDVLDLLASLTDKSLVSAEGQSGTMRYRLLETVRQYARERLMEGGDDPSTRDRHLGYFCAMSRQAEPKLRSPDAKEWLDRLDGEHENLRAALTWSLAEGGDAGTGLKLASGIVWFWLVRGYLEEGRDFIVRLLAAAPGADASLRARTMTGAGILASYRGDYAGARPLHEEALEIFRALDDRYGIAMASNNIGIIAVDEGDYATAQLRYEECIAIMRELGDRTSVAAVLTNLGTIQLKTGDLAAARTCYEESLVMQRELGDRQRIAVSLQNLGLVEIAQQNYESSISILKESLTIAHELADRRLIVSALDGLASVATSLGALDRAARLLGQIERLRTEIGYPVPPNEQAEHARILATVRATLSDADFEHAWREGMAMEPEVAIRYAAEG